MQRFPWVTPLAYWLSIRKPAPGASLPPVGREVRSRRQYPSSQRQGQSRTVATHWPGNGNTNVRFWPISDHPRPRRSHLGLLGHLQGIVDFDAEVSDRALKLAVPE